MLKINFLLFSLCSLRLCVRFIWDATEAISISQVGVHDDHLSRHAGGAPVEDRGHLADPIRRIAVGAHARRGARGALAEAAAVWRAGAPLDAGNRVVDAALHDLVAPDDVESAPWAGDGRRDAVAVAVDVDDASVGGYGVSKSATCCDVAHVALTRIKLTAYPN